MTNMQIARPPPVSDLAYQAMRDRIVAGEFEADRRLTEVAMAVQLGVSRTPIREAMARLALEGYLIATGSGYKVPTITAADVTNMSEVRELLEPAAARQAAINPADIGIADMKNAIEAEQWAHNAGNTDGFVSANLAYRAAWLKRATNPLLLEALAKAMLSLQLIRRRTMSDPDLRQYMLDSHHLLLAAIKQHDGELAARGQTMRVRGFHKLVMGRLFS